MAVAKATRMRFLVLSEGRATCEGYGVKETMYVFHTAARLPCEHVQSANACALCLMRSSALAHVPSRII